MKLTKITDSMTAKTFILTEAALSPINTDRISLKAEKIIKNRSVKGTNVRYRGISLGFVNVTKSRKRKTEETRILKYFLFVLIVNAEFIIEQLKTPQQNCEV